MSRPFSRYLHQFDTSAHPAYEPEVANAKLATWALDCGVLGSKISGPPPAGMTRRNTRLSSGFMSRIHKGEEGRGSS
jgi:hypothetical protein